MLHALAHADGEGAADAAALSSALGRDGALSTRTGAEALVHTLQAKTQADPHLTVLSVDISAAYDTVSREAMLSALREVPQASALMPFVRLWYARESVYVWAASSQAHRITQAEGGEQGDPLMPALFALAPSVVCMRISVLTSKPWLSSTTHTFCARGGPLFSGGNTGGLLTFLLGQHGASILEQDIAALRQPNALPRGASPPPPLTQAPSPQVVPAAPAPRRVRPHVCLTGAPDTTQGDHAVAHRHDDAPPLTDDVPAAETSQGGAGHSALAGIPAAAWSSLDAVDLAAEVGTPVPTMQSVPVFLRSGVRQAIVLALLALREAYTRGTAPQQTRAWKLFLLAPRLLLHRPREPGTVGGEALLQRSRDFLAGRWDTLLSATRTAAAAPRAGSAADVADAADAEAFRERRRALAVRQCAAGRSFSRSRYLDFCCDRPRDGRNLRCIVRPGAAPAGALARRAC